VLTGLFTNAAYCVEFVEIAKKVLTAGDTLHDGGKDHGRTETLTAGD